jgi:DNA-directed RNA polymerase specialized sigma24 family protein
MSDGSSKGERGGAGGGGARKGGGGRQRSGQQRAGGGQQRGGQQRAGAKRGDRGRTGPDPVQQLAGPLQNVLKRLPATQREVIEWRMGLKDGHPHDLADTARQLGLSMSEARDIEKRAFEHIREVVPLDRLQKLLRG